MSQLFDQQYGLYINGQWRPAEAGATFSVYNPANGTLLCQCAEASRTDVDEAVQAARKAFISFKQTSVEERAGLLQKIADAIQQNIERISLAECLDTGKLKREATALTQGAVACFRYFAGAIETYEGSAKVFDEETMSLTLHEPIGVVGQVIPWNVPLCTESWKLAPALATGCTVVIKPSSQASLSTLEFVKCIEGILPAGVLNVVTGGGSRCGQYLLDHPGLDKLSFTGSTDVGKAVGLAAAEHIIPATLELGGKSANIVFPDADRQKVMAGLRTFLFNAGQVCSAGSRLFLHETIYDEIVEQAAALYDGIKVGLPWRAESEMGALAYSGHLKSVLNYVNVGLAEGATLACGGYQIMTDDLDKGCFMRPTLLANVTNDMRVAQEEIFGPVLVAIKFKDEDDVLRQANDSPYGLSGYVFTQDINRAMRIARGIATGRMMINTYGRVRMGTPFGGYKQSGMGREAHWKTFDYYTQTKNIMISLK